MTKAQLTSTSLFAYEGIQHHRNHPLAVTPPNYAQRAGPADLFVHMGRRSTQAAIAPTLNNPVYRISDNAYEADCYKTLVNQNGTTAIQIRSLGNYPRLKKIQLWFKNLFSRFTNHSHSYSLSIQDQIAVAERFDNHSELPHLRARKSEISNRWRTSAQKAASLSAGLRYGVQSIGPQSLAFHAPKQLSENYWCEFFGIRIEGKVRNIFINEIRPYYEQWCTDQSTQENFQSWMAKQYETLAPQEQEQLKSNTVTYLSRNQRLQAEVTLEPEGRVRQNNGNYLTDGEYMFALGVDDSPECEPRLQLCAGKKRRGKFQHSSFFGGRPVHCAGLMEIDNAGKISSISGYSGHYKPGNAEMTLFMEFLAKHLNSAALEAIDTTIYSELVLNSVEKLQKFKLLRNLAAKVSKR